MITPIYRCYKTVADDNGFPMGIQDFVTKDEFIKMFGYEPELDPVAYVRV